MCFRCKIHEPIAIKLVCLKLKHCTPEFVLNICLNSLVWKFRSVDINIKILSKNLHETSSFIEQNKTLLGSQYQIHFNCLWSFMKILVESFEIERSSRFFWQNTTFTLCRHFPWNYPNEFLNAKRSELIALMQWCPKNVINNVKTTALKAVKMLLSNKKIDIF